MSELPIYLGAFVVVLGVLIVVHELGHYAVARWCGVRVLRFSVGFGRPLWQRVLGKDGTEWSVGLIPLGGYVKMLDEREAEVAPGEVHRAFNRQTVGKRSAIVAAGPLANLLLAFVLYWFVFMHGSNELLPILGRPAAGSPAAVAGIRHGDTVRSVDGQPVASWSDFRWSVLQAAVDRESVELETVDESGVVAYRRLPLSALGASGWEGDAFERLGLGFYRPAIPPILGGIVPDGAGERAGLQVGDEVVAIDDVPTENWTDVVLKVRESAGKRLRFTVARGDALLDLSLVPEAHNENGRTIGRIGVAVADSGQARRELRTFVSYGPIVAAVKAAEETWDKSVFSLSMLGKMLTGEVSWKNLSGPVSIADYAGQSARLGLDYYLKFMALVSISLGILNLLPIPVLDGGYLMYHLIEVIRRRPLSERAMEISQRIGVSILLALMTFAFFNDVNRLFSG